MLLDDEHQDPEESRAAWISETEFRKLKPYERPAPAAQQQKPYGPLLLAGVVGGGLVVALLLAVAVVAVAVGIGA
ncbi:hypothetical protein, partial [Streptomyces sp. DSM 41029]